MAKFEMQKKWLLFWGSAISCFLVAVAPVEPREAQPLETPVDSVTQSKKHLSFGYRYLKNKQHEDAESQFKKSWEFNTKNGRAAYYLGRVYYETERYEEGAEWISRSIDLLPKSSKNLKNAYYFLGQIHVMLENPEAAIRAYEALLTLSDTPEKEIQYLHFLVNLHVEIQDYVAALEYAQRWGELDPENPDVQEMIGKLHLHTGGEEEAMAQMEKVMEMNPEDFATLEDLADMYRDRGMPKKGFEAYERLHRHDPENFLYLDYLLGLGTTLGRSKDFRRGILHKMLVLQADNLSVIEQLADETGSLTLVNRGLKIDPGNGKLNYMKGEHYYKKWKSTSSDQDSVRAMVWYRKAKRDPQWRGNAQRMIDEIDPPLTEEEKKLQEFFKKKKKEEVNVKGKK